MACKFVIIPDGCDLVPSLIIDRLRGQNLCFSAAQLVTRFQTNNRNYYKTEIIYLMYVCIMSSLG